MPRAGRLRHYIYPHRGVLNLGCTRGANANTFALRSFAETSRFQFSAFRFYLESPAISQRTVAVIDFQEIVPALQSTHHDAP